MQADKDGNATIVTSDSIRAGQNKATVDENGVTINGNSQGIYSDNKACHTTDANGNDAFGETFRTGGCSRDTGEEQGWNLRNPKIIYGEKIRQLLLNR